MGVWGRRFRVEVCDGELLEAVADGDGEALGELWRRWRGRVVGYFRRRGVGWGDVDELAVCWLETVWFRRCGFVGSGVSASDWLFGIAWWELGKYRRRRMVEARRLFRLEVVVDFTDSSGLDELEDVEERIDARTMGPELWARLDDLPAGERLAVILRVVQARPYAEVAEVLGCSEGAARMRVHRGLEKLRRRFGSDVVGPAGDDDTGQT